MIVAFFGLLSYLFSSSNGFLDFFADKVKKSLNLQRAITHEVFFSEFIKKLIRSSSHRYQSIHRVMRL